MSEFRVRKKWLSITLSLPGKTVPLRKITIMPGVSGVLKAVYVEEGDFVKEGDLLAEIDEEELRINLRRAEKSFESARVLFEQAQKDFIRAENLFKKGVIPQVEFEKAKTNYKRAKAMLDEAEARLMLARKNLEKAKIRSPIRGKVVRKNVDAGMTVFPQTPLFVIHSLNSVFVAGVPEKDVRRIKKGKDVVVKFPSLRLDVKGEVEDIFFSEAEQGFFVRVKLQKNVMPGVFGTATIRLRIKEGIFIPYEAVGISPEFGEYVFLIKDGILRMKKIRIRERFGDEVEVEGLSESDIIVREITDVLYDGMKVRVIKFPAKNE